MPCRSSQMVGSAASPTSPYNNTNTNTKCPYASPFQQRTNISSDRDKAETAITGDSNPYHQPTASPATTMAMMNREYHLIILNKLCSQLSQLDLLAAGSLLLLPSVVPYLTSALLRLQQDRNYTSGDVTYVLDGEEGSSCISSMLLSMVPFLGMVVPIVTVKVLNRINNKRVNSGARATRCPFEKFKRRFLSRDCCRQQPKQSLLLPSSTSTHDAPCSPCFSCSSGSTSLDHPRHLCSSCHQQVHQPSRQQQQPSTHQPQQHPKDITTARTRMMCASVRPKTIVLTCLCLWTFLMVSAPRLGLNNTVTFSDTVVVSKVSPSSSPSQLQEPLPISPSLSQAPAGVSRVDTADSIDSETSLKWTRGPDYFDDDEEEVELMKQVELLYPGLAADLSVTAEQVEAMVQAAEEDDVMDSEWDLPWSEEHSNDGSGSASDAENKQNESLEEESALRDFWDAAEEPGLDAMVADFIDVYDESTESILNNIDRLGSDSENPAPVPAPLPYTTRDEVMSPALNQDQQQEQGEGEEEDHVFEYIPGWTEAMLFCVSLSLGGIVAGLNLARSQGRSLVDKLQQLQQQQGIDEDDATANKSDIASIGFPRTRTLIWLAAFGLNCWILQAHYWNLPATYFACLGGAFMILAQTWLPNDFNLDLGLVLGATVSEDALAACYIPIPLEEEKTDEKQECQSPV